MNINDWFQDVEYGHIVLVKKDSEMLTFSKMYNDAVFNGGWKALGWVFGMPVDVAIARIARGQMKAIHNPAVVRTLNEVAADPSHPGYDVPMPNSSPENGTLFP